MRRETSIRVYAALQRRLWPAAWRQEMGEPALQAFEDLHAAARRQGLVPLIRLWVRELGGLLQTPRGPERKRRPLRDSLTALRDDLRFAVRQLRKRPGFAFVIVATLALGLGAASAAITLADAILLRPLPWSHADRLVQMWTVLGPPDATDRMTVSPADWVDLRESVGAFEDIAAHNVWTPTLVEPGSDPARVDAALVTPNFFDVMGVEPVLGTGLGSEDTAGEPAVVLSYGLWRQRYGGDPAVLGRTIQLDGRAHRIEGVLPQGYRAPEPHRRYTEPALYAAFSMSPDFVDDRGSLFLRLVGRLKATSSLAAAQSEAGAVMADLAGRYSDTNANRGVRLVPVREELLGGLRPLALMILAAGAAILAIVWGNVANLLLVRAQHRRPEMSLRAAVGAPRARLLAQLLAENSLLALIGGALGFGMLLTAANALASIAGSRLPALVRIQVDVRTGLATLVLVALTTLGLTLLSALGLPSARPGTAAAGRVTARLRGIFAAGEVGIAVALLIAATLLTQSLTRLTSRPIGIEPDGVTTLSVTLPRDGYADAAPRTAALTELQRQLAALPGVRSAGIVSDLPFTSENRSLRMTLADGPVPPQERPLVEYRSVSGDYFVTLGIEVLQGRVFNDDASVEGDYEIVVNRAFVERFLGARSPLGTGIVFDDDAQPGRIVGVVGNVRDDGFAATNDPMMYLWQFQTPYRHVFAVVRSATDAAALADAIRDVGRRVEPSATVADIRSFRSIVRDTLAAETMASGLSVLLSVTAMLLAALGIYGVMAHLIASRTREIGVRTALGARSRDVVGEVMGHAARLATAGAVAGVLLGWAAARGLSSLLFGIAPEDPFTLIASPVALILVALIATWAPARRAARVSPLEALRSE